MKRCEIFHVPHHATFRWKWRYRAGDGTVIESDRDYELFYECVVAARAKGYQPEPECL